MVFPVIARMAAAAVAKQALKEGAKQTVKAGAKSAGKEAAEEVSQAALKNAAARKSALEGAEEAVEGGVKVTKYPYAGKPAEEVAKKFKPDLSGEIPNYAYTQGKTPAKYAKGGSASSRGDGCAQRGKTRA